MIPRLLHQTCRDPSALPAELRANVQRLQQANPGWRYRLYSDEQAWACLADALDAADMDLLRRLDPRYGVVLADLFRYVVCHREGGVYLDIKSTLTRPLDEVLHPRDQFLLSQWRNAAHRRYPGWGLHADLATLPGGEFQQWFVASAPGHPFLAAVIKAVLSNLRSYRADVNGVGRTGVLRVSGPICYSLAIAPIMDAHPRRLVDIHDLGFEYSLYELRGESPIRHMITNPNHYSHQGAPILRPA